MFFKSILNFCKFGYFIEIKETIKYSSNIQTVLYRVTFWIFHAWLKDSLFANICVINESREASFSKEFA